MHDGRVIIVSLAVLATLLAGCTAAPPAPEPAADALAAALQSGSFDDVPLAATTQDAAEEELAAVVDGLGAATRTVEVVEVEQTEADGVTRADVALTISWDLDGEGPAEPGWSYDTSATLVLDQEADPAQWQAEWAPAVLHPDLAPGDTLRLEREQPARAEVLGADDAPLVTQRPVDRVGIDKVQLGASDPQASARALAAVVGVDGDAYAERVGAAGEQAFVEAIVLRSADAEEVRARVEAIPGGRLLPDELPLAPSRTFARALLGTAGPATAEVVEASAGAVVAGDVVGLSGLQLAYDDQLRGVPGFTVRVAGSDGVSGDALHSTGPVPGEPLRLTLDPVLQQLADDLLVDVAPPSAVVAVRPSTGELLAVASGPGGEDYSTATLGRYAPGSVFKIATTLALLRAGASPQGLLPCTSTVTVDGKTFTNYSDFPSAALGDIPLSRAFAESCNTAFISQVDALEPTALADAAASLGVGSWPDLGFDVFAGSVDVPPERVERAAAMIGQSTVLLSPVAAAVMAASTVAGPVVPRLLVDEPETSPSGAALSEQEAATLGDLMRGAVTGGTAEVLADVPGGPVAAKTGTAEFGTQVPPQTHGWMVAVQGDLAVAVFVEEAESGSATAGPILAGFLTGVAASGR